MGLEPVSQPMPAPSMHSIVDVLSSGGCGPGGPTLPTGIPTLGGHLPPGPPPASVLFPNMSAVTSEQPSPSKIPKTEYKPEQLATLLQVSFFKNPLFSKNLNFPAKTNMCISPFEQKMCQKKSSQLRVRRGYFPNVWFKTTSIKNSSLKEWVGISNFLKSSKKSVS